MGGMVASFLFAPGTRSWESYSTSVGRCTQAKHDQGEQTARATVVIVRCLLLALAIEGT